MQASTRCCHTSSRCCNHDNSVYLAQATLREAHHADNACVTRAYALRPLGCSFGRCMHDKHPYQSFHGRMACDRRLTQHSASSRRRPFRGPTRGCTCPNESSLTTTHLNYNVHDRFHHQLRLGHGRAHSVSHVMYIAAKSHRRSYRCSHPRTSDTWCVLFRASR